MGIKRLNKYLLDINSIKIYDINDYFINYQNSVIAIDVLLYTHKYKFSCDNIYAAFINQIIKFLQNKIIPLYVIDGKAPIEKQKSIKHRLNKKNKINDKIELLQNQLNNDNVDVEVIKKKIEKLMKNNINIDSNLINNLINLFKIFNVPFIRATGEADVLISDLYKKNIISLCLSEDTDLLTFGCKKIIKIYKKQIYEYDLDLILKNMDINYNQFIEICILLGCDYLQSNLKLNVFDIIKSYKNNTIFENLSDKYIHKFNNTKNIYTQEILDEYYIHINIDYININELILFIQNNCSDINYNKFKYQISFINSLIKNNKFNC
jgi:5'-3' exonuclease